MRLFTDGKQVVLRLSDALVRWKRKSDPEVELRAPKASITTYQRDGILALSPSGRHDFTADAEALEAQEAVAFDEERVATLVVRDDRFALLLGPPGDDDPPEIPLDALNPKPIAWPDGKSRTIDASVSTRWTGSRSSRPRTRRGGSPNTSADVVVR